MQTERSLLQIFRVACFVVLPVVAASATAQLRTVPAGAGQLLPCEVGAAAVDKATAFPCGIIVYSPGKSLSTKELSSMARTSGAQVRFEYTAISGVAATAPDRSSLRALHLMNAVLIPDRPVSAIQKPPGKGGGGSSAGQVVPEGVKRIGAAGLATKGNGVGVAIVDTGLDFSHQDLSVASSCFDAFGSDCRDGNGHGTHVGGTVAALDNGVDVVGVAPGARLYAVRVLNNSGSGSDSTIMAGLDWIYRTRTDSARQVNPAISVANMSLGRPGSLGDNMALRTVVAAVKGVGVTIVVAAGNDPEKEISEQVPAAYPEVLAIASTTAKAGSNSCNAFSGLIAADTASYFTTDGSGVTVSAPGEDQENINRACMISSVGILSLKAGGGTTRMSGTSMASPHVAGVAALLIEQGTTSPDDVRARIKCSAQLINAAPLHSPTGRYTFDGVREGILSAAGALSSSCQ